MSRPLTFRVWDKDTAKYVDGVGELYISILEFGTKTFYLDQMCPGRYIVEQHTGLKDKNGKEIYEGDIVKAKIDGFWQTGAHTVSDGKATWNLEVVYNDIRYMDVFHILGSKNQPDRIYYLFDESISDIEVIGNVHENKELLGGDE